MDYSALILEVKFLLVLISYNSGYLNDPPQEMSPQEPFEYCTGDEFRPRCGPDEVILVTEATYGRVSIGRCFRSGEQQFGCVANFTQHLDTECSGLRSCTVRVPTATMNAVDNCRPLRSALYASYRCIKVVGSSCRQECKSNGRVRLTGDRGYLPSAAADREGCGSARCPWSIEVLPGQSVMITLFDFTARQRQSAVHQRHSVPSSGRCSQLMTIKERTIGKETMVCGGRERQRQLYMSVSHFLELQVLNEEIAYGSGQFLVYYEAIGCPDVVTPKWSRMKRMHDRCEIDCPENPSHKWILNCVNNHWVGEVGSCPPLSLDEVATTDKQNAVGFGSFISTLPLNVLVTLVVAATVIVGVIIITTGIVCLKKNSYMGRHRPESIIYTGASSEFEFRQDLVGARCTLVAKTGVHEASLSAQSSKPRRPSTDLLMPAHDNTYAAERCMETRPLPAIPDSSPQSSVQRDPLNQVAVQVHPNVVNAEMNASSNNQLRPVVVACRGGTSAGVARDGRRPQPPVKPGRGGAVPGTSAVRGGNHHYFVLDPDILVEEPATLHSMGYRATESQTQAEPMRHQIFPDEHVGGRNRVKTDQCEASVNDIPLRPIRDSSAHPKKHSQQKFNDSGIGSWP